MNDDDEKLNDKLFAAQQELAAIKHRYSTMPAPSSTSTMNIVSAAAAARPNAPAAANNSPLGTNHPAQKQLETAEAVMLKLYKKNLALEHQIRQLKSEIEKANTIKENIITADQPLKTVSVPEVTELSTKTPTPSVDDNPSTLEMKVKMLQNELNVQRASCARFAAQNGALRSDFNRLSQQQIQPLLHSSSIGHATQEVLSLLLTTLNRFENERTAEINDYTSRLKKSEEARIELLAKCKFLERKCGSH
jgi:hypothetical protein